MILGSRSHRASGGPLDISPFTLALPLDGGVVARSHSSKPPPHYYRWTLGKTPSKASRTPDAQTSPIHITTQIPQRSVSSPPKSCQSVATSSLMRTANRPAAKSHAQQKPSHCWRVLTLSARCATKFAPFCTVVEVEALALRFWRFGRMDK